MSRITQRLLSAHSRSVLNPQIYGSQPAGMLEKTVAFTIEEIECHQQLLDMAAIKYDAENRKHESVLKRIWLAMMACDFESKSRRWRELGFQGDDPRTDFRGGGFMAVRCMCFMAEEYQDEARRWAKEAEVSGYLFAAACINVCCIMVVQLGLNAQAIVPPVKSIRIGSNIALKRFMRRLAWSDDVFAQFGELFVSTVRTLHTEWLDFCRRKPGANLLQFGEVLQTVDGALECSLCRSDDPAGYLRGARSSGATARFYAMIFRTISELLCWLLRMYSSIGSRGINDDLL